MNYVELGVHAAGHACRARDEILPRRIGGDAYGYALADAPVFSDILGLHVRFEAAIDLLGDVYSAIRFPRRKKFFNERSTFSALYTSPRFIRFCSASGVKSTITVSEAVSGTQSGTVSRTMIPVIDRTTGAMLSMC